MKCIRTGLVAMFVFLLAILLLNETEVTASSRRKVVLISIDGLRPEFYLEDRFDTPTLKRLRDAGTVALSAEPVFPSLTYPNHITLITGLRPANHGILSNTVFTWEKGPSPAWYWESSYIKSKTLFDFAKARGLTTASVRWPVTLKAENITHNVPEIFSMNGFYEGDNFELTAKFTEPKLMQDLLQNISSKKFTDELETDHWAAEAAAYILKSRNPDLLTVHLANVDHVEHGVGREGAEVNAAVKDADKNIAVILSAVDLTDTCVIITGDHGFFDVSQKISPNVLFAQKGWITLNQDKVKNWRVIAHASGGQAAIYVKEQKLLPEVRQILQANASAGYTVIDRAKLDRWGAYPEAAMAIEGQPGFTISGGVTGTLVSSSNKLKGNHGYQPENPDIQTGFIASGCGIRRGKRFEHIRLIDIAPTIANLLQLQEIKTDGQVLNLF